MSVKINRFNLGFKYFGPKEYCSTGEFMAFAEHASKMAELREEHANYRKDAIYVLMEKDKEITELQFRLGQAKEAETFWNTSWNRVCQESCKLRTSRELWKKKAIVSVFIAFFFAFWAVIHCLWYAFGG